MASVIQIANRALTKLGAARIISLDDDNKQARAVKSCFEDLRDDELRSNRWSFAMKRTSLAADAEAPAYGYTSAYTLPADFLRLDLVNDEFPMVVMDNYISSETNEYTIEGNKILANIAAPLKIRYVARIDDPQQMDILFHCNIQLNQWMLGYIQNMMRLQLHQDVWKKLWRMIQYIQYLLV